MARVQLDMEALCEQVRRALPVTQSFEHFVLARQVADDTGLLISRINMALVLLRDDPKSGVVYRRVGTGIRAPFLYARSRE